MSHESHYSESYFTGHYGALVDDERRYHLLAKFWRATIANALPEGDFGCNGAWLDYGAGSGVVSASFENAACYDIAEWSQTLLRSRGRVVHKESALIPRESFDGIICSHSLEHHPSPLESLGLMRELVKHSGRLVLMLPVERTFNVSLEPDWDQHFYCWNFQTIANLLRLAGWQPVVGKLVHGPFMLTFLGRFLPEKHALRLASIFGRVKRGFPTIMVVSTPS